MATGAIAARIPEMGQYSSGKAHEPPSSPPVSTRAQATANTELGLVLQHTNFEATMSRFAAMLCRRARLVPNQAPRAGGEDRGPAPCRAPGADFGIVATDIGLRRAQRFETCVSEY